MLSSDAFEGRKPGTAGETKAVAYIEQRMQAIGLKPAVHGKWTQDVPLVAITADPKTSLAISGGAGTPLSLAYGRDVVMWTKRQVARQALDASQVVFVGYGINAPERGWNDYAGLDVRGKTVLILVNDPDWRTPQAGKDAGPFEGRAMTYYGRYTYKYEEAMRQGAAAAFVIHDTEPAGYGWNVITSSWTGPQIDLDLPDKGMKRVGIEGWLTHDAAARLLAAGGQDLAALEKAASERGFKAVATPLKASAALDNSIRHSLSKNVIGVLPGAKRPNEYVLYSAHWDHLGHCPPDATGDGICNGAVDNASGVAGLLAVASDFARGKRPERSVLFLAVTGEESGLLGSRWYAENPIYPLKDTVGGVNMDSLNVFGRTRDVVLVGAGKSELEPMFAKLAAAQGRTVRPEATPEKGGYFRSDHFSFARVGVPMLSAGSGTDAVGKPEGYGRQVRAEFTAKHYHQPSDQYDSNWDWSGAVEDLTLYEQLGRALANSSDWPGWLPGTEFKAARDAQRPPVKGTGK
jgi:Zn-dependent M28 family amino/carboxypeptidase